MFPTCEAEILHTTTNLKASTSEGFDNISTKMLKQTMKEVATPLAHIVNLSLSHGIFPDDMKLAKIVPIFKNGNTKLFNNYRPISILPAFSKILEKIVCNRLLHFLETKNILYRPLSRRLDRCDRVIQNESRDSFGGNVYYVTM